MYPSNELATELRAINAHHKMMERHLKDLTKEVETESPTFTLKMKEKIFYLSFNLSGYSFNCFDIFNRPDNLKSIITIQKEDLGATYIIRCFAHAKNEQIYSELEALALPM